MRLANVQKVAVVVAFVATIALFPLKCPADAREKGAELTFDVGRKPGYCHRNDTNAAKVSRVSAAVSFVSAAAIAASISTPPQTPPRSIK